MDVVRQQLQLRLSKNPDARRLFFGRGRCFDGYSDLVIDWYPPVVHVVLYQPREDAWLQHLTQLILQQVTSVQAILLQQRFLPNSPCRLLWGQMPEVVDITEAGLTYRLRLGRAQNVGFFLDMAAGRQLVRDIAADKTVLNLFAYTCSFSVAALSGRARQVVNLDMNKGALQLGRTNHQLNNLDDRRVSFLPMEFFKSVSKLRKLGPYDLVICDPPASQGKSFSAQKHWPKLLTKLSPLLTAEAQILACLNATFLPADFLQKEFSRALPDANRVKSLQPGPDFPYKKERRHPVVELYKMG